MRDAREEPRLEEATGFPRWEDAWRPPVPTEGEALREVVPDSPATSLAQMALPPVGSDGAAGRWTLPLSLSEAGRRLVEAYEGRGDCALVRSGYLDLLGKTWAMVVGGPSWSEVCVIRELEEGESCAVAIVHLDAGEWERRMPRD